MKLASTQQESGSCWPLRAVTAQCPDRVMLKSCRRNGCSARVPS